MKPTSIDPSITETSGLPHSEAQSERRPLGESKRALSRRQFLERSTATALAAVVLGQNLAVAAEGASTVAGQGGELGTLKKAVCIGVLPKELSLVERFKLAKAAGFEGVEPNTIYKADEVSQYKEASEASGLRIHSIMNSDHWQYPLTDNDPAVVRKCIEGIKTSLHNAKDLGADTVLLVPGIVTADVRYVDAYERSQQRIKELLPLAEELKVKIAIENVGNRFLLSPLEFVRYIDEINSPYLQGYFDIGNLGSNGFPQDWIRTFGKRLVKVHIKAMEPGRETPRVAAGNRRAEGINWIAVRRALSDINYHGWFSAEVRGGDEAYLRELSHRLDKFIAGESPV
jgi:L-ribulose-5-phosphate 3-epimerase